MTALRGILLVLLLLVPTGSPARGESDPVPRGQGVWPLLPRPVVVRAFDPPGSPYGAGHRGVDLLGAPGQQVHAALAGTITFASGLAGRGVVVVDHGAVRTTYEPVTAGVAVGQHVGRGSVIGSLSGVGSHCPPRACLHWGLLRGETYLDPLVLVGAGPVRLLPLGPAPVAVVRRPVYRVPAAPAGPTGALVGALAAASAGSA